MSKIVRKGFTQAMNGAELWVNTSNDQIVKFVVDNQPGMPWEWYNKHVKITIEKITEEEYDSIQTQES